MSHSPAPPGRGLHGLLASAFSTRSAVPTGMMWIRLILRGADPPVIRNVAMEDDDTMADLEVSIRSAFGWSFMHSHKFYTSIGEITNSELWENPPESDERNVKVADLKGYDIVYLYDFGDCWQVSVVFLEDVKKGDLKDIGEDPPEDCGGVYAFNEIRQDPELRKEWLMDERSRNGSTGLGSRRSSILHDRARDSALSVSPEALSTSLAPVSYCWRVRRFTPDSSDSSFWVQPARTRLFWRLVLVRLERTTPSIVSTAFCSDASCRVGYICRSSSMVMRERMSLKLLPEAHW